MVFEHQMHMMNLLTRIGWQTRKGLDDHNLNNKALGEAAQEVVDYMLFVDEAPRVDKIQGTSGIHGRSFRPKVPSHSQGRSLRQLDLQRRLMKYPCSYMIYSDAFDDVHARKTRMRSIGASGRF